VLHRSVTCDVLGLEAMKRGSWDAGRRGKRLLTIRMLEHWSGGAVEKWFLRQCYDGSKEKWNELPRSRAAKYRRGLKSHFVLEGDTLLPLPNKPLPRFHPAAELRGILLIKVALFPLPTTQYSMIPAFHHSMWLKNVKCRIKHYSSNRLQEFRYII